VNGPTQPRPIESPVIAFRPVRIAAVGASDVAGAVSRTLALPGSPVYPIDEYHVRHGRVGGQLARCWFGATVNGVNYVWSFRQGGSAADPAIFAAAHVGGYSHRYIDLGSSSQTAAQVIAACIASLALDGITATDGGTDAQGRRRLVINGATNLVLPPAVARDLRARGIWGAQRDDWGEGAVTLNANGGTTGTGVVHLSNPNTQPGMAGRAGRVLGVAIWAHGGFAPRLVAFTGPGYSLDPTALTLLGQNVAAAIGGAGVTGFGGVVFDAAPFAASANLWAGYRENSTGGPRYRLHGQTPLGRGDQILSQRLIWDTTSPTSAGTAFGATYTPVRNNDFEIYISITVMFELADASGNYPADGSVELWHGDQNTDPAHGIQFQADPTFLTGETTHHRFLQPAWPNHQVTTFRRVYTAALADETSRVAFYGPWVNLSIPASPPPPLLADAGLMGVITPNAVTTYTLPTPVSLDSVAGQYLSVGTNYVRTGAALTALTLPVYLDATPGDGAWTNAWEDGRTTWHDNIPGASGRARAPTSGVSEYRTRFNAGMPNTTPAETFPATMVVEPDDDSPVAIANEAYLITAVGMAAAA
jgi:hypothetical protein